MAHRYLFSFVVLVSFFSSFACFRANAEVPGLKHPVFQERSYFCWAALTEAFAYIRGINVEQCKVVNRVQDRNDDAAFGNSCCLPNLGVREGDGMCNERFMIKNGAKDTVSKVLGFSALSDYGILYANKAPRSNNTTLCTRRERGVVPDCRKVRINRRSGRMSRTEIKDHVLAGRPVGLFFQFSDFATGHFIWIAGIHPNDLQSNNPRYIIMDPYEDSQQTLFLGSRSRNGDGTIVYRRYADLARAHNFRQYGLRMRARWVATGVGKNQTDP